MGLLDGVDQGTYYGISDPSNIIEPGSGLGNYQFVTLDDIISSFMVVYVGENKILTKVSRTDVQFHGMRAIQELSYDVLKSMKSQEIEVPPTLKMMLPHDYVNYCKIVRVDSNGIEKPLYPTGRTSNPFAIEQEGQELVANGSFTDGDYSGTNPPGYWTVGDNWEIDTTGSPRAAKNKAGSGATDYLEQTINLVHNGDYEIKFTIFNFSAGDPSTAGLDITGAFGHLTPDSRYVTSDGDYTITARHNSINGDKIKFLGSSGDTFSITNISVKQTNNTYQFDEVKEHGNLDRQVLKEQEESNTWANYKSQTTSANSDNTSLLDAQGRRYGLDPQHAQANGTFYIDNSRGYIHFGSNLAGETIILKYISDGLGTDAEMLVHKFAEEAVYKWIMYGLISGRTGIPEYITQRFKKEKFAETRKAKIRLSNIKMEEFTQVLRGISKPIK